MTLNYRRRKGINLFQLTICLFIHSKWNAAYRMWKHIFWYHESWRKWCCTVQRVLQQSGSRCSPDISNYFSNPHLGSSIYRDRLLRICPLHRNLKFDPTWRSGSGRRASSKNTLFIIYRSVSAFLPSFHSVWFHDVVHVSVCSSWNNCSCLIG